jgi:hypothetical protein
MTSFNTGATFERGDIVTAKGWGDPGTISSILVVDSVRPSKSTGVLMAFCRYYKNPSKQIFEFHLKDVRHVSPLTLLALQAEGVPDAE